MVLIQGFRRGNAVIATCAAALAVSLAVLSSAQASGVDAIGRANLDGSSVRQSFIPTSAFTASVVVDSGHIYWTNNDYYSRPYSIARANLDGTGVQERFITLSNPPAGLAVDAGHVYWTSSFLSSDSIGRADLDGTDVNETFVSTETRPSALAVDASHIYWTVGANGMYSIARANLDGSGIEPHFIDLPSKSPSSGLAVDASHIYWTTYDNTIGRANLDGSGIDSGFVPVRYLPTGLAVDANYLYFTTVNTSDSAASLIGRASLDGSGLNQEFITGASRPSDIAVDAGHVYWTNQENPEIPPHGDPPDTIPPGTNITGGPPRETHKARVTFEFSSDEAGVKFTCRLDRAKNWRACSSPTTLKHLDRGNHRFRVRAVDSSGNVDLTPAKRTFRIRGTH